MYLKDEDATVWEMYLEDKVEWGSESRESKERSVSNYIILSHFIL